VILGVTEVSEVLTCTSGTWDNIPTSYAYQWKSSGVNVGTNSTSYTLQSSDLGNNITVVVTATNAKGSRAATSAAVGPITAAAWTPASLGANLIAWYKADTGVYNDAGTTPATNGQTVQQWNDQSGHGYHLNQAVSGDRPTFQSTGFNGAQTVSFATQFMSTTADAVALGGTTLSVFAVGQMLTGTASYGRAVSFLGTGAVNDYDNTASVAAILRNDVSNGIASYRTTPLGTQAISLATNYRLGAIFDGANQTLYVNNVAGGTAASTGSFAAIGTLYAGKFAGGTWAGPLSEIVVTNTALSSGERTSLDNYFKSKWVL
jgi:hypothetical protein